VVHSFKKTFGNGQRLDDNAGEWEANFTFSLTSRVRKYCDGEAYLSRLGRSRSPKLYEVLVLGLKINML